VRLGVVADTHGVLHPGVPAALSDVARILHAGDVGGGRVLEDLARVAPVDAVRGNVDPPAGRGGLPDGRILDLGGRRILLVHAFPSPGGYQTDPTRLDGAFRRHLARLGVEVVCFGHRPWRHGNARESTSLGPIGAPHPRRGNAGVTGGRR
jgi:putative phosphoesterase